MNADPLTSIFTSPARAVECPTVADWSPRWRANAAAHPGSFERAIAGGADADRMAWAFASGYQAALRVLDPTLPDAVIAALCVTEAEGNHPRAIQTTLAPDGSGFTLSGEKRWATLGPDGGLFLIVAREFGNAAERPSLKAVRVSTGAPGLTIDSITPTGFVPEVPHARVRLEDVRVEAADVLPGGRRRARHDRLGRVAEAADATGR